MPEEGFDLFEVLVGGGEVCREAPFDGERDGILGTASAPRPFKSIHVPPLTLIELFLLVVDSPEQHHRPQRDGTFGSILFACRVDRLSGVLLGGADLAQRVVGLGECQTDRGTHARLVFKRSTRRGGRLHAARGLVEHLLHPHVAPLVPEHRCPPGRPRQGGRCVGRC